MTTTAKMIVVKVYSLKKYHAPRASASRPSSKVP